jgi:hypothetical protein
MEFSGVTLGEEPPGMPLTGKRPSPSAKNRTLGEAFPKCHPRPRGRFNTVGVVSFFLPFPECNTRGRNFLFLFWNLFPECNTRGRNSFFLKPLPRVPMPRHSGKPPLFFLNSLPRVPNAQALGKAPCPFFNIAFPECQVPRHSGKPLFFVFLFFVWTTNHIYIYT